MADYNCILSDKLKNIMIKQGVREIFDNISLSVISFLESHIGISDVEFIERQGKMLRFSSRLSSHRSLSQSARSQYLLTILAF